MTYRFYTPLNEFLVVSYEDLQGEKKGGNWGKKRGEIELGIFTRERIKFISLRMILR